MAIGAEADNAKPGVHLPEGMRTDLASVPRMTRSFAMLWQMTARSGILHNGLYRWFEEWEIPRRESDGLYYESLITVDAPRWRVSRTVERATRYRLGELERVAGDAGAGTRNSAAPHPVGPAP